MNGAANGERNQSLFDAACQMRDAGNSQHEIQTALMSRALEDGLDLSEVNKTIVSTEDRDDGLAGRWSSKSTSGMVQAK